MGDKASEATAISDGIGEKRVPREEEEEEVGEQVEGTQARYLPFRQLMIVYMGIAAAIFLAALDSLIISTCIPSIIGEFNSLNQISWITTAFLLTQTIFQPMYGKASDVFGRRNVILSAIVIFEVGNIVCGAAPSMVVLIIGRAVSGIGAGGIVTMSVIIISDVVSLRERGKYQGIISAVFAVSSIVGPLLGGVFADHVSWRWAFYINAPLGLVSGLILLFFLRLPAVKGSFREKLGRIDWYGCAVLAISLVGILLAISWGGNDYAWSSGPVLGTLLPGIALLGLFIWIEMKVAVEPVVSTHVFRNISVSASLLATILFNAAFFGMLLYTTVYFQMIKGESPTTAGLELAPMMLAIVFTSILSGFLTSYTGRYRFLFWAGTAIMAVGSGLLTLLDENTTRAQEIGYLIVGGAGIGMLMQPLLIAAQSAVDYKDVSLVSALSQFFRSTGNMIGTAVVSSVFNNSLISSLESRRAAGLLPSNFNVDLAKQSYTYIQSLSKEHQALVLNSYVQAIRWVNITNIPFCLAALLVSLLIRHYKLSKNIVSKATQEDPSRASEKVDASANIA
ncbi:uncharacterized protein VTP21DRAFT_7906 [Calcarisporiella thermophila]|uniref:uncharacterized protein n=1 Tax=Calcarisporiella thermophila TaxID=911321 RepID=UPI003742D8EC